MQKYKNSATCHLIHKSIIIIIYFANELSYNDLSFPKPMMKSKILKKVIFKKNMLRGKTLFMFKCYKYATEFI